MRPPSDVHPDDRPWKLKMMYLWTKIMMHKELGMKELRVNFCVLMMHYNYNIYGILMENLLECGKVMLIILLHAATHNLQE